MLISKHLFATYTKLKFQISNKGFKLSSDIYLLSG